MLLLCLIWVGCISVVGAPGLPDLCTEVNSLEDAARWSEHNVRVLCDHLSQVWYGDSLDALKGAAVFFKKLSLSTAFSGTGGIEVNV